MARYCSFAPIVYLLVLTAALVTSATLLLCTGKHSNHPTLRRAITSLLYIGFAAVAACRYHYVYHYYEPDHIVNQCSDQPRLATIRGTVVTPPYIAKPTSTFAAFDFLSPNRTAFTLRCESAFTTAGYQPISGLVRVNISEAVPAIRLGQKLQIDCSLRLRTGPDNPGQIDRADAYHTTRTLVACYVNTPEAVTILANPATPATTFNRLKHKLRSIAYAAVIDEPPLSPDASSQPRDQLTPAADQNVRAFLAALVLGQRYQLPNQLSDTFIRTGTFHFLSISGFHVALFAAFIWWLTSLAALPRWARGIAAIATVLIFLLIVPPRAPVIRAAIITITFSAAYMFRRRSNSLNFLALAAIIILLWRPVDLFAAGFQLSFVVVVAILILAPALYDQSPIDLLRRLLGKEPLLQLSDTLDTPRPSWRIVLRSIKRRLWQLTVVSLIAWLVAMPLIAVHVNRVTPWCVLNSIVLAPLISITLLLGFAKLFCVSLIPLAAPLFTPPLHALSELTLSVANNLARLPYSSINTASPPIPFVLLFYALLIALAWTIHRHRRIGRHILLALLLWLAIFAYLLPFAPARRGTTTAHFLDVGHGTAVIAILPDGKTICYDAGSIANYNITSTVILPFLRAQGIQRIDALFVSHPDIDHYVGVLDLCGDFDVRTVYLTEHFSPSRKAELSYCDTFLLTGLETLGQRIEYVSHDTQLMPLTTNDSADQSTPYRLDILWPPPPQNDIQLTDNDTSLVLRITTPAGSILLPGDVGRIPQQQMLRMYDQEQLQSNILLLAHHASEKSLLPQFIDAVNPDYFINSSNRLDDAALAKLTALLSQKPIYHTFESHAVTATITTDTPTIQTFSQTNP